MDIVNKNFLIVDDDAETLEILQGDLTSLGVKGEILKAENGKIALEMTRSRDDIDFIICDMVMPVCDGLEFLTLFRTTVDTSKRIPFLMLTSKSDKGLILQCIKAGVSQYLLKPWTDQQLSEKIIECAKKHS
jgi:two-component system chemotaxis response regulator CheY